MPGERTIHNLNSKQQRILILLYRFRYASLPLLKKYLNLTSHSLQYNFNILERTGYLMREYDGTARINREPALYYLTKQSIRFLKQKELVPSENLHVLYKNAYLTKEAKLHFLQVLSITTSIRSSYDFDFEYFTKTEIAKVDYFPKNKPDIYLKSNVKKRDYFVLFLDDPKSYAMSRKLRELINYFEDDMWDDELHPGLLFVLFTESQERRFHSIASRMYESAGISSAELPIATTTTNLLLGADRKRSWLFSEARQRSILL